MKGKKLLIEVLIIVVLSTSFVFAGSVNGQYNGFPVVKVNVNGKALSLDVPGIAMQSKTLLPVRAVAENLNAIVIWNESTMTANLIQPEVDLLFVNDVEENDDGTWNLINPFGYVDKGKQDYILLYYEITNISKQTSVFKVVVHDTDGKIIAEETDSAKIVDQSGIYGILPFENITFDKAGAYTFEFQMLYDNKFQTVAKKTLFAE
ncbi:hypothetical protein SDC9_173404 [bioreactor metagenome]|uniref:Copper amine oxidase-like N-terminal domain-containing protein n=1 Tax=bioreactor metagenome TaxID=1076179 RepID=A0A645GJB3_9ZZZZ